MQITGIISEYNPFHNGHKYLIEKHRENNPHAHFIAVMSGNFTQRGEAAILNKWQRARLAVAGGIDLVIELPFVFAVRSAQHFAFGGVDLLQSSIVSTLSVSAASIPIRMSSSALPRSFQRPELAPLFQKYIAQGISYASAVSRSIAELTGIGEDVLKAPNTILGIEYLKAVQKLHASFDIDIIQRVKAQHNDLNYQRDFASGTAIRHCLYKDNINFDELKQVVPLKTFRLLQQIHAQNGLPLEENLFLPLLWKLRLCSFTDIQKIYGINEGLEYKLLKASAQARNKTELLNGLKSKRYPYDEIAANAFIHYARFDEKAAE